MVRLSAAVTLAALLAAGTISTASQRTPRGGAVTIQVSEEMAPPGGMAQMKIRMTDAQPIITARASFSFFGIAGIEGISLAGPGDDAAGIAVVRGTDVALSIVSPNATLGTDSDYPLVTVLGRVPDNAPIGATFPLVLDADSLQLVDPNGVRYITEVKSGQLVAWPSLTIHEVRPGSATLSGGSLVTILGSNFQPATEIRFDETALTQVLFVSPTRMDVVLAQNARMHGLEVEARNPDGSQSTFFSYQRTSRTGKTGQSVMKDIVPIFQSRSAQRSTLYLSGATTGVALQNLERTDAVVVAELFTASGAGVAATTVTLPSNTFLVRELSELFRIRNFGDAIVDLRSATPVQVLGVSIDSTGTASPRLPQ
jgi:hypothetical protein